MKIHFYHRFLRFLEYALNKFMPTICVAFISFYSLGFLTWEPYFYSGTYVIFK